MFHSLRVTFQEEMDRMFLDESDNFWLRQEVKESQSVSVRVSDTKCSFVKLPLSTQVSSELSLTPLREE